MGMFTADPAVMASKGNTMINQSEQFLKKSEEIYKTIDEMIANDYLSPEARAIANKIYSYKDTINELGLTIDKYGKFLVSAGKTVVLNQENIIDSIR